MKLIVRDPVTCKAVGARVDGRTMLLGGPLTSKGMLSLLVLDEDDILMHKQVDWPDDGRRWKTQIKFKHESGLSAVVDRWRTHLEVCEVRSFRRLMR